MLMVAAMKEIKSFELLRNVSAAATRDVAHANTVKDFANASILGLSSKDFL
jgi:hypothetical protein